MSQSRQLAAIMFTDIVGYTALMGKDEQKAMQLLDQNRVLQKPLIEEYRGKYLKEMGDGILASFSSAGDAVSCALDIQKALSDDQELTLRIGIHLGDITFKDEDVFGDGVNIAARIQAITDPGGIFITESIHKAIRGRSDIQAQYLGETQLKNVDYPVKTYALQGEDLPIPGVKNDKELSGQFRAELQRRGVIRAAISYLVVALLLVLLWNQVQDWGMTLPQWFFGLLLAALGIGFPVALYLAWNYERSPEGFVKTTSPQSWQNPLKPSQRKPLTGPFIIAGLMLVIVFMYFYPRLSSGDPSQQLSESGLVLEKSIAVLPFRDISPQKDQEWFGDGMMGAILDHMTKIPGLKVTSRTSVMQYKGSIKTIPEIAEELGVSYLLEGGVQVIGEDVRITAQLLDLNDKHLWSEQFDRSYEDIFVIQTDIAEQIAATMQATIGFEVSERINRIPTNNLEAYNNYLQARFSFGQDDSWDLYERAIELDPEFSEAYSSYGTAWYFTHLWQTYDTLTNDEIVDKSYGLLKKALELDSDNARAHFGLGQLYCYAMLNLKGADEEYRKAQELSPSNPGMTNTEFLLAVGRFKEGLTAQDRQIASNPNDYINSPSLPLYFNNKVAMALKDVEFRLKRDDYNSTIVYSANRIYLWTGNYRKVIDLHEQHPNQFIRIVTNAGVAYHKLGQQDKTDEIIQHLKSITNGIGSPAYCLGMIYAQMGQIDTAFKWLNEAYEERQGELYWLKHEPTMEPLRDDPRYLVLVDKIGFPE